MSNPNLAFKHKNYVLPSKKERINLHQAKLLNRVMFETGLTAAGLYRATFMFSRPVKTVIGFFTKEEAAKILEHFQDHIIDCGD
jgi:hypothetical protein